MKRQICSDYKIVPGTNITEALYRLFCENPRDTEFVLEPGDYAIIISPRRTVKNIGDILT